MSVTYKKRVRPKVKVPCPSVRQPTCYPGRRLALTLLSLTVLTVGVGYGLWTAFNMGRGLAAPGLGVVRDVRTGLKNRIVELEAERQELRQQVITLERDAEIEREAARDVRRSLIGVQNERLEMKEEIALLSSLLSDGNSKAGLRVRRFELEPLEEPGSYRYRFALSKLPQDDREVKATVGLEVKGQQGEEETALDLADMDGESESETVVFKQLTQVEGTLKLPEGFEPERLIVKVEPRKEDVIGVERELAWVVNQ